LTIKKIAIIGPESTGKSTLSEALASALHTVWVPEYAREYLQHLERPYILADLALIAKGQIELENSLLKQASEYLICDTTLDIIAVWSHHKYQYCDPIIEQAILECNYDLYIVTDIDFPWEDDPLREHPEAHMRSHFFEVYKNIAQKSGKPYMIASGTPIERLNAALEAIRAL